MSALAIIPPRYVINTSYDLFIGAWRPAERDVHEMWLQRVEGPREMREALTAPRPEALARMKRGGYVIARAADASADLEAFATLDRFGHVALVEECTYRLPARFVRRFKTRPNALRWLKTHEWDWWTGGDDATVLVDIAQCAHVPTHLIVNACFRALGQAIMHAQPADPRAQRWFDMFHGCLYGIPGSDLLVLDRELLQLAEERRQRSASEPVQPFDLLATALAICAAVWAGALGPWMLPTAIDNCVGAMCTEHAVTSEAWHEAMRVWRRRFVPTIQGYIPMVRVLWGISSSYRS